ncbi:helix-turn-helix domain-containing protein [Mycobacterium sp. AT1]|uniref:AraC-like ligand-binding domain-containing protein n=1 Tax=Mycobacterium sp. AT1 TaxID=1961706 RepID=UPI0009ADAC82|nr:helix-turn-helix domain-containing protein [Mycobacterium sp. AT1]OPX10174.1 hypothetical protein B1790_13360 [Mycobacterium sp. AT1]
MSVLIETLDLPSRERADFWRSSISESFVPMDTTLSSPVDFAGSIRGGALGTLQAYDVTADAHISRRTPKQAAAAQGDFFKLSVPLRGYCVVMQDGREAPLTPGDLAVYDTSRSYTLAFEDTCELLVLMFPQQLLRIPREVLSALTAQRVSGRHGVGALVAPLLKSLVEHIDEVDASQSQRVADTVLDLLSTVLADQIGGNREPARGGSGAILVQAKSFIESHLHDVDLTPDAVAFSVHISTGYLHKLFRREDTSVARYIRDRRLEHCRRDLADPHQASLPVSIVGAHWGFIDAARFSRVFKAAYGTSPREYRLSRDVNGVINLAADLGMGH